MRPKDMIGPGNAFFAGKEIASGKGYPPTMVVLYQVIMSFYISLDGSEKDGVVRDGILAVANGKAAIGQLLYQFFGEMKMLEGNCYL